MAATKIKLPKQYENDGGKYPQFKGKEKLSYSQHTSWKDPEYKPDYIVQYFSGIKLPSGIFADFGSEVGEYKESMGTGKPFKKTQYLTKECKDFLASRNYPENSVYEDEIVIDLDTFVVQAFTDRTIHVDEETVELEDFKTGNSKKQEFYSGEEYGQTTLYCYGKSKEGKRIGKSSVILYERKGNNTAKHPLRLSGQVFEIDTPYNEERAEKVIADIKKSAEEISEYYRTYQKYFGDVSRD